MITSFDPFERNRMKYTVKNRCIEEPDLNYEDGALTIYLYVSGNPDGLPEELIHLLRYMNSTTAENEAREHNEWRMEYMTLLERDEMMREEGRAEEHKNTLREMQRADSAEQRAASLEKENALLKEQLAALKKLTPS